MKKYLLKKLRKIVYVLGFGKIEHAAWDIRDITTQKFLISEIRRRKEQNALDLCGYEYQVMSQNGEDGILHEIFSRIGETNKYFVEFGVGNGVENNTAYLLLKNWHGAWIEGSPNFTNQINNLYHNLIDSSRLKLLNSFIKRENILSLFEKLEVPESFDLLAIDIDGNDYWVWKEIAEKYNPRVISIEYNAALGPHLDWVMPYNANHVWGGKTKGAYFGASLKSFERLGEELGYNLVGTNLTGVNAFFVRKDLVQEKLFNAPFTSENHFNKPLYFMEHKLGHMRNHEIINSIVEQ